MPTPSKLESAIVLPPESISQNWVSKDYFDLSVNLTLAFKIKSTNPVSKEAGFGLFLVNSEDTAVFGATTSRGATIDYASKGEVGEAVDIGGIKQEYIYEGENIDLLLDHVYEASSINLCKNQNPFNTIGFENKNIITIFIDSTKSIVKEFQDAYKNIYFDELIVRDFLTEEVTNIDLYNFPCFIQILNNLYICELIDILNQQNNILRISFENYGRLIRFDLLENNKLTYSNLIKKYIDLDLRQFNNIRLGYVLTSPVLTYDSEAKADFTLQDFQIQGKLKQ